MNISIDEIIQIVKNNSGWLFGWPMNPNEPKGDKMCDGAVFVIYLDGDDIFISFGDRFSLQTEDDNSKTLWAMCYENKAYIGRENNIYIGKVTREQKREILSNIYWKAVLLREIV